MRGVGQNKELLLARVSYGDTGNQGGGSNSSSINVGFNTTVLVPTLSTLQLLGKFKCTRSQPYCKSG